MINQQLSLSTWCEKLGNHRRLYLAVVDAQMHLSFVNSHFFRAFQQMAMPGHDRMFGSLVDEQDLQEFKDTLFAASGDTCETTVRIRMKNGLGKWVQWHPKPLDTGNPQEEKWLCLGYELPVETPRIAPPKLDSKAIRQKKLADSILRAQHEERARIGHELHDNVNQILTSAHLYLSCLNRENPDFDFIKGKTMEIILQAVEEVRNLSREMVLPDFRNRGLIGSIDELVADLRYSKVLDIDFQHADVMTLESQDPQLKLTLFRIIQEQIKNILKHSQAKQTVINLHADNEQVRLLIRDYGIGFDSAAVKTGLGLSGIRERASLLGGRALIDATPGKGCLLIVTIPLELKKID